MDDRAAAAGVVVIGVGNRLRGDDAAGLVVAERVRRVAPPGTVVHESDGDPVDLLGWWERADTVVMVDAVVSGVPPGTVATFDCVAAALPAACFRQSTHLLSIAEAVELARVLGGLPRRMVLVGIEAESFAPGAPLTAAVAAAVDGTVAEVLDQVGAEARIVSGSG